MVSSLWEAIITRTWSGLFFPMLFSTSSRQVWYICDVASKFALTGSSYPCSRARRRSCSMYAPRTSLAANMYLCFSARAKSSCSERNVSYADFEHRFSRRSLSHFQITLIGAVDVRDRLFVEVSLQFIGKVIDRCLKVALLSIDHNEDIVRYTGLEKFTETVQHVFCRVSLLERCGSNVEAGDGFHSVLRVSVLCWWGNRASTKDRMHYRSIRWTIALLDSAEAMIHRASYSPVLGWWTRTRAAAPMDSSLISTVCWIFSRHSAESMPWPWWQLNYLLHIRHATFWCTRWTSPCSGHAYAPFPSS